MITSLIRIFLTRSVKPFIFSSDFYKRLDLNVKEPGLYFHIPFCRKLCPFCPYYKVEYNEALLKDFSEALMKEIKLVAMMVDEAEDAKERLGGEKYVIERNLKGDVGGSNVERGKSCRRFNGNKNIGGNYIGSKDIGSIYFGGGSPALAINYLPGIINLLKSLFNVKGNMGIELHPSDINENLLEKLKECGFNMVSIGVQSFQDKCISALGREWIDSVYKLRLVKEFKFDVVDVDLIFGIPGQGKEDLLSDFRIALENGVTQISTYPFIEFSYTKIKNKPLDRKQKKEMLESLIDAAEKSGFKRSSIWTFSNDGSLQYSSVTRENFIGFGPGAATLLKDIFKINVFSVNEYIEHLGSNDTLPTALTLEFSLRARASYWLFWSAYKLYIDEKNFYELFSKKVDDIFKFEFYLSRKLGYIEKDRGGYKLTRKGAYLFHLIEQVYTHQYIDKTWRAALNAPWPERIVLH